MNSPEASVYWLMGDTGLPIYIGLTRNLRSRISMHKGADWFTDVCAVGAKFFATRAEAEVAEAVDIGRLTPIRNKSALLVCEVIVSRRSGRPPHSDRAMTQREMEPPYYFARARQDQSFDALFERDRRSELAGYDQRARRPCLKPCSTGEDLRDPKLRGDAPEITNEGTIRRWGR